MRAIALATAAALVAAAARPASAQAAAQSDVRRADVAAAPAVRAAARTVAEYRIRARRAELPAYVTVADSAGELVASYRVRDDAPALPMTVSAEGVDLVLRAQTDAGPLTLILDRQNGDAGATFTGRWRLGTDAGFLVGRVQR